MSRDDRSTRNGEYRTLTAEHADGWHMAGAGGAHPRCPECRREGAEAARIERLRAALERQPNRRYRAS